jgi:hypothetical protein
MNLDSYACVTAMDIANVAYTALAVFGVLTIIFGIVWLIGAVVEDD